MGGRLVLVATYLAASDASAEGVCVEVDTNRDSLAPQEQYAVRVAVADALAKEGIALDPTGAGCTATVVVHNIKLGKRVTTTIRAGDKSVTGEASSLDELDLSIKQLVRSLVTGKSLATGSGVQDRYNVLRDQTAPRRRDPSTYAWDYVVGIGGGMLQLPATDAGPLQRQYNLVVIDTRMWGYPADATSAFEIMGRIVMHDWDVFSTVNRRYDRTNDDDYEWNDIGTGFAVGMSPFAVANYEAGLGFVKFGGLGYPRPYVRIGVSFALLCRFSDPEHRFDVGLGPYAGLGLQLTKNVALSVSASTVNPLIHDFADSGYWYFMTTSAMLEFRSEADRSQLNPLLRQESVPTIRRINE